MFNSSHICIASVGTVSNTRIVYNRERIYLQMIICLPSITKFSIKRCLVWCRHIRLAGIVAEARPIVAMARNLKMMKASKLNDSLKSKSARLRSEDSIIHEVWRRILVLQQCQKNRHIVRYATIFLVQLWNQVTN